MSENSPASRSQQRVKVLLRRLRLEQYRLLTRSEEYFLVHCYQNDIHKREVADAVVLCNMGLIRTMAAKHLNRGLPYDDLINAGMCAVLVVLDRFDVSQKNRLSTVLVPWIHQHMGRSVNNYGKVIRIPDHMCAKVINYSKHESAFQLTYGRMPTIEEMHEVLGLPMATLRTIKHAIETEPISMDTTVLHKTDKHIEDMMIDNVVLNDAESTKPYDAVLAEHPAGTVTLALSLLDQRELTCLLRSHGMNGHEKETYQQIGKSLGITRARVDQILQKAYAKIREAGFTLEDFA